MENNNLEAMQQQLSQYQEQISRQQQQTQQMQQQQQQQMAMREQLNQMRFQMNLRHQQLSNARTNQQRAELRSELKHDVRAYNGQAEKVIANTKPTQINKNWENDLANAIIKKQEEHHRVARLKENIVKEQSMQKYTQIYDERIAQGMPEWKAKAHTMADIKSDIGIIRRNQFEQHLRKERPEQKKEQQAEISVKENKINKIKEMQEKAKMQEKEERGR